MEADNPQCSNGCNQQRGKGPTPFLRKTYELLEGREHEHIVSWNSEGDGFVVWSPGEFSQALLPTLFKHCNFSSFVRQLNAYGFKKLATDRCEFQHDKFRRGEWHQLEEITRRKSDSSIYPSFLDAYKESSSSSSSVEEDVHQKLLEENKALREENAVLRAVITQYACSSSPSELAACLPEYFLKSGGGRKRGALCAGLKRCGWRETSGTHEEGTSAL